MLFKDHIEIVTDAGVTLHLGWDYDTPYFIDPLNGVDVDLQTAQGINQTGTTVERQSVSGVSRTLSVVFWGEHKLENSEFFTRNLPYFTKGTLYFGDKYFTRFVVQKTPYFSSYTPDPRCSLMLYSPKPFWYDMNAVAGTLNGFLPAFRFPVNYSQTHRFGVRANVGWVNVYNPGALAVPFTATLKCDADVVNPHIHSVLTGQNIGLQTTLVRGDVVEIYRTTTDKLAVKRTRDGVEENIFSALDEDSDLFELAAGDNLLKTEADSGADNLQATFRFYPMVSGIIPEVMS